MAVKILSGALLAAMLALGAAEAQDLAQVGGPANMPPRGYRGLQFVDSRGCLFLRAGFGGNVNWVARIDRKHKPICGMLPTGSAAAQAAVEADMAPDPNATPQSAATATQTTTPTVAATTGAGVQTTTKAQGGGFTLEQIFGAGVTVSPSPAPTVFGNGKETAPQVQTPVQVQTPAQARMATQTYQGTRVATSVAGVQCYADAPKLERVEIAGGTALVCTRGDGSASGWRPPMVAAAQQAQMAGQPAPVVVAPVAKAPVQAAPMQAAPVQQVVAAVVPVAQPVAQPAAQPVARSHDLPKPPKGWVYAWKDDRLNPLRGVGTPAGQAQQDQVWAATVPLVLVTDLPQKKTVAQALGLRTTVSTMSAPVEQPVAQQAAPVTSGRLMVQVGCFGDAANVQGTASRLAALGLPVATATTKRKGKALQIVYVGPFATLAEAQAGLATLHGAGFPDAFLR